MQAKEARVLTDNSDTRMNEILETQIFKNIKEQAEKGKSQYIYYVDACEFTAAMPEKTAIQLMIIDKLKSLGYGTEWSKYGSTYIPRGLVDNYHGTGPQYINYGIIIRW